MGNNIFFILFLALVISGCSQGTNESIIAEKSGVTAKSLSVKGIQETKSQLQDGDIILRTGNDVISSLFAQLNQTDKTFSHCGIAFCEEGKWMVYHSIGGEDNPDEKLRKDPFEKFIGSDHNLGYAVCRYPLTGKQSEKLQVTISDFFIRQVPFDMKFDLHSDDRLYCAEMVYKAFNKALDTSNFFKTTVHKGFEYVSTDNIFINNKALILCHIVY
jgi:hypothetical protein